MTTARAEAAAQAIEDRAVAKGALMLKVGTPVAEVVTYLDKVAHVADATRAGAK
jgi:hypothetical protein